MTMRNGRRTVTFARPFSLRGIGLSNRPEHYLITRPLVQRVT